jgi:hypothetical protein
MITHAIQKQENGEWIFKSRPKLHHNTCIR